MMATPSAKCTRLPGSLASATCSTASFWSVRRPVAATVGDTPSSTYSRCRIWFSSPGAAYRAHRFYERCGFERTGRTRSEPLGDWQRTPAYEEVDAVEYALSLS
jgi:hypothetical protein